MNIDWQQIKSSAAPGLPGATARESGAQQPATFERSFLWGSAAVVLYVAVAYRLVHWELPAQLSPDQYLYVAQPLIWCGLAALSLFLWSRLADRPALSWSVVGLAVLAGGFQIAFLIGAGMVFGFGHSPYGHTADLIVKNGLYIVTLLAGLETSRAYLLHTWGRINSGVAFAAVAILFALVTIPPAQFDAPGSREAVADTVGTTFLPNFADSLMATFFASIGGPLAAFAYMFTITAFEWFAPILPSLQPTVNAFVRTVAPLLSLMIARDVYEAWTAPEDEEGQEAEEGGISPLLIVGSLVLVGLIWFQAGLFGVQPAIVSGTSMEPDLSPYDMTFTKKVEIEDLSVGDVIRYRDQGRDVIHRIVAIPERTESGYFDSAMCEPDLASDPIGSEEQIFCTKGDANNTADDPVAASQIRGKVVFTVPKGGWLPSQVKELAQSILP
jgi:signal peptidase